MSIALHSPAKIQQIFRIQRVSSTNTLHFSASTLPNAGKLLPFPDQSGNSQRCFTARCWHIQLPILPSLEDLIQVPQDQDISIHIDSSSRHDLIHLTAHFLVLVLVIFFVLPQISAASISSTNLSCSA